MDARRERLAKLAAAMTNSPPPHPTTLLHRERVEAGRRNRLAARDEARDTPDGWRVTWKPKDQTRSARKAARQAEREAARRERYGTG
jgi:hypothetical protein